MNQALLKRLETAYSDLDLYPLVEPEAIERFRVDYGLNVLVRLESEVDATGKSGKVVFAGHRGCGKSTLLKRFAIDMQSKYFVVAFSISDSIEMSDVSHVNILYSMALQLLHKASVAKISVADDIKKSLLGWMNTERKVAVENELKSELGGGGDLFDLVTIKLQRERVFREEVERKFERQLSELVGNLDRLAATIQGKVKKPVLVIIDDLDKLDLTIVERIYRENLKSLFSPAFKMVLTIPVSAVQEPKIMSALKSEGVVRPQLFPVAKFFSRDDCREMGVAPDEKHLQLFQTVLAKRFPEGLLSPEMARQIALMSGGVMRELVRIARECCTECMVQLRLEPGRQEITIDEAILRSAIGNLRNDFARQVRTKQNYDLLLEVYQTLEAMEGEVFVEMLHGLIVLEYENGDLWYDLHPIVLELLKRRKLIA